LGRSIWLRSHRQIALEKNPLGFWQDVIMVRLEGAALVGWKPAVTTLVTFLETLIVSMVILYATYGLARPAVYCVRLMGRTIG
jgi:hypothetical protein